MDAVANEWTRPGSSDFAGKYIAQSLSGSGMAPPVQRWVESLIESLATRAMQKAEAGDPHEVVRLERMGREAFLADRRRWDQWLSIADLEQITGCPRSTIQRYPSASSLEAWELWPVRMRSSSSSASSLVCWAYDFLSVPRALM